VISRLHGLTHFDVRYASFDEFGTTRFESYMRVELRDVTASECHVILRARIVVFA